MGVKRLIRFIIVCGVGLLQGCQGAGLQLANALNSPTQYHINKNIPYGVEPWQKLDVYLPKNGDSLKPTVVFYYGGGWTEGRKEQYAFVADYFARNGFVTIVPDYAKYPAVVYPAFVEDAAAVSRWVAVNSTKFQLDASRIHLIGHSAGAHIGAILVTDTRYLSEVDLSPTFYRSFVGLAGPYAFTPEEPPYTEIFGPPERFDQMQATNFITGNEPPMLLMHGEQDSIVDIRNAQVLAARVDQHGGNVRVLTYRKVGHISIVAGFSRMFPVAGQVSKDLLTYLLSFPSLP